MRTDYKFWYIKRDDDGFITEAAVKFYEGDYVLENGKQVYKRIKRLQSHNELKHLAKTIKGKFVIKGVIETNGSKAVFYEPADFGQIKTDDELRNFLNKELGKDKMRTPVKERQWRP